jgi:hypothetical protein
MNPAAQKKAPRDKPAAKSIGRKRPVKGCSAGKRCNTDSSIIFAALQLEFLQRTIVAARSPGGFSESRPMINSLISGSFGASRCARAIPATAFAPGALFHCGQKGIDLQLSPGPRAWDRAWREDLGGAIAGAAEAAEGRRAEKA